MDGKQPGDHATNDKADGGEAARKAGVDFLKTDPPSYIVNWDKIPN